MGLKLFLILQKRLGFRKSKKSGFTILELLVAVVISGVIVIALVDMVVDLLQSERREYARNETQREMQMALDYMVNDLREAAYVYNNDELNVTRGTNNNIPPLRNYLPQFDAGFEPILAFWKPEQIPYQRQDARITCPNPPAPACANLQIRRRTFTLVVYYQKRNEGAERQQWKGISRITRYQLRMYKNEAFNSTTPDLTQTTPGYVEPLVNNVSFSSWPGSLDGNGNFVTSSAPRPDRVDNPVLVDFVDYPIASRPDGLLTPADPRLQCPRGYTATPPENNPSGFNNPSFAVCVSSATQTPGGAGATGTNSSTNQDIIVFLRGNPTGKAGVKVAPLIAVRTQAVARGVIDKKPE